MDVGQMTSTAIVPISLPLTTGAGTMSTITVYASAAKSLNHHLELLAAIVSMALIIALMFSFAARLTRVLGHVGMTVLIKVMGLFTLAIGIQFVVTGSSVILSQIPLRI
jgi:multiple antibiotic resistance protein